MTQSQDAAEAIAAWLASSAPADQRIDALLVLVDVLINASIVTTRRGSANEREALAAALVPLRSGLTSWAPAADLPPFAALLGCLHDLLRGEPPHTAALDDELRGKFGQIERLAHTSDEDLRAKAIAENYERAERALLVALEQSSLPQRELLAAQIEAGAADAVRAEPPASPWHELAGFLRAAAALLRGLPIDTRALGPEARRRIAKIQAIAQPDPQLSGAAIELPATVLHALMENDAQALDEALAALPEEERAEVMSTLDRQMQAQMTQLSELEQRAVAGAAQRGQIAAAAERARDLARHALAEGSAAARADLAAQISSAAAQAAEGEPPGSPWVELRSYLDAVAALLRGQPLPPVPLAYREQIAAITR